MIIDAQIVLGQSRYGTQLLPSEAIAACERSGIGGAIGTVAHPVDHDFARANRALADAVDTSQGRLVGLARADPWEGSAADILHEMVRQRNFRGIFLHPAEDHFRINDHRLKVYAELAVDLDVPVVIASGHPWLSEPTQVGEFASWCPSVPVVMTNGGQFNISGLSQTDAESALGQQHVHLFTTGVYREDFLQKVVATYGAHRVLFASAAPHFDQRFELKRVQLLHVGDEEKQAILGGNASRVFSLQEGAAL